MGGQLASGAQPSGGAALRSDVRRNRELLLRAARDLLATGDDVPMYEIARRAGVGQATLYRHFPDRAALAGAVGEQLLDELDTLADHHQGPDAFVHLLRATVDVQIGMSGLARFLHEGGRDAEAELTRLKGRIRDLFAASLGAAEAAGTVRPDLHPDDLVLMAAMLQGGVTNGAIGARATTQTAARALDLLLHGCLVPEPEPAPGRVRPGGRRAGGR